MKRLAPLMWSFALVLSAHAAPTTPTWRMFGPPGNVYDYSALDPVTRRQYVLSPSEGTDSVLCMWSTPIDSAQDWQLVETIGLSIATNANESHGIFMSAIDPSHRRWIVGVANDTGLRSFSFDSQRWSPLSWVLRPPSVAGFETAIDSSADRLYSIGGPLEFHLFPIRQGPPDSRTLDSLLAAPLDPPWDNAGSNPYTLRDPAFALDARRHRLWVHGGQFWSTTPNFPGSVLTSDNLWMFDLTTSRWSLIAQSGPAPSARFMHHFEVDTLQDRLIMWGGLSATGVAQQDWWTMPLGTGATATWSSIVSSNAQPRPLDVGVFDPVRRVFSFAGGSGPERGGRYEFSLDGTPHWSTIVPDRTDPPNALRLFYDASRDRARLVTARTLYDTPVQPRPDWSVRLTTGRAPDSCVFVHDPARHRVIALGGKAGVAALDTVQAIDVDGGDWTPLSPTGVRPPARYDAAAVLDREHDRILMFGGRSAAPAGPGAWLDDLWALSLSGELRWTRLDTLASNRPTARQGATLVADSAAHRIVIWGGRSGALPPRGVMAFSWDQGDWSTLTVAGTEPAWQNGFSVWDPTRRRLWVMSAPLNFAHLYTLTLAGEPTWAQPELQGSGPFMRGPAFVAPTTLTGDYDAAHDRILIHRHAPGQGTLWSLSMFDPRIPAAPELLESSVQGAVATLHWFVGRGLDAVFTVERRAEGGDWTAIDTPTVDAQGEVHHTSTVPELGTRYAFRLRIGEGSSATLSAETTLEFPRAFVAAASITGREPQSGELRFTLVLPTGLEAAELSLHDLQGRLVWRRRFAGDGRRYDLRVNELTLTPGLYFARLSSGSRTLATHRATWLR